MASLSEVAAKRRTTIVFLHGTRLTGAAWAEQVRLLSDEFHCLAPDLPGHGTAASLRPTLDSAADHVAGVVEREARGGRAIVVGLSLGGYVAMTLAANRPDLVAGLVVAGGTAEPVGVRGLFYTGLGLLFRMVPERILDAANAWFFRWRYPPAIAEPIVAGGFWFAGGSRAVRSLVGERFRPRLAAYGGRALLINGELDLFFRPGQAAFARSAADARQVVLPRALHLSNLDQPAAFADAVRRFAREIRDRDV